MKKKEDRGDFVGIGASLGGIFMIIVIVFLAMAKDKIDLIVPIAYAFVVLGVFLGLFQLFALRRKK